MSASQGAALPGVHPLMPLSGCQLLLDQQLRLGTVAQARSPAGELLRVACGADPSRQVLRGWTRRPELRSRLLALAVDMAATDRPRHAFHDHQGTVTFGRQIAGGAGQRQVSLPLVAGAPVLVSRRRLPVHHRDAHPPLARAFDISLLPISELT